MKKPARGSPSARVDKQDGRQLTHTHPIPPHSLAMVRLSAQLLVRRNEPGHAGLFTGNMLDCSWACWTVGPATDLTQSLHMGLHLDNYETGLPELDLLLTTGTIHWPHTRTRLERPLHKRPHIPALVMSICVLGKCLRRPPCGHTP